MATSSSFEVLSEDRVRLGAQELRAFFTPGGDAGGDRWSVEVTADSNQPYAQYLAPHELRNVRPVDLPNGFSLSIERLERARLVFSNIHFLTARKQQDKLTLSLSVLFDYADWHLPVSLSVFAEEYATSLVSSAISASVERWDSGININCSTVLSPQADLFDELKQLSEHCLLRYRECLSIGYAGAKKSKSEQAPSVHSDSSGPRWWVRYVLVPLAGSGAFAAAVAALIAIFK